MKKSIKMLTGAVVMGVVMATTIPSYAFLGTKKVTAETTAANTVKTEYTLLYNGTEIKLDVDAAPVLKALGAYAKCFEQQSCAYQGMDKVYTYPGIELGTYPVDRKEHVSSIYFIDKSVETTEGIKLGSTYNEMVKAYGHEYQEEFGVYRYILGNTEIIFYTTNKVIDAIEYQIKQ